MILEAAARLTGLGPQHLRIDWLGIDGLAARALTLLFSTLDAGPCLSAVSADAEARPSVVARAVRNATGMTYEEIRRRRCLALLLAHRARPGTTWKAACEGMGTHPRNVRRHLREALGEIPEPGADVMILIKRVLSGHR